MEKLRQRWHERSTNFHDALITELEREKIEKVRAIKEQMTRDIELKEAQRQHIEAIDVMDEQYYQCSADSMKKSEDTGPLLLDEVLVPIEESNSSCSLRNPVLAAQCAESIRKVRNERNDALCLAQHYRDIAEKTRKEKRDLKNKLENEIEIVRNFWRNKIVEGKSRSGKILRESLLRN